jgi:hypothetical protein
MLFRAAADIVPAAIWGVTYPAHLTRPRQIWLAGFAMIINALIYWRAVRTGPGVQHGS